MLFMKMAFYNVGLILIRHTEQPCHVFKVHWCRYLRIFRSIFGMFREQSLEIIFEYSQRVHSKDIWECSEDILGTYIFVAVCQ